MLVTGHTGFKGAWLCQMLLLLGAEVSGFALAPNTQPNLYTLLDLEHRMDSHIGDIRDLDSLKECFHRAKPEIVFHLAAQPIVKEGYRDPVGTYSSNVMGTAHVLECCRQTPGILSIVNITTDKVYEETGKPEGYTESDRLDGFDPYANSKSCSELVTASYRRCFLSQVPLSTARAGNVIGGGDFAPNRIVPDCVRAAVTGRDIILRNPNSIRPYQHVLEPLTVYLLIAMAQAERPSVVGCYNVGPDAEGCVTTGRLAELFVNSYGGGIRCVVQSDGGPHEAAFLKLDCSHVKEVFEWHPRINVEEAIAFTVEWTKCWQSGGDISALMDEQIKEEFKRNGATLE